jgi:hypothetical protein
MISAYRLMFLLGMPVWLILCLTNNMKLQLEATPNQIKQLLNLLANSPELAAITQQLSSAEVNTDVSQEGEIPEEGDNEKIERNE